MNIWLISAFEPLPVDKTRPMRFMGIAEILCKRGHKVTFWSSTYNHFTKSQRFPKDHRIEISPDYTLKLVFARPYRKNISLSRLLSHAVFSTNIEDRIKKEKKPDAIYLAFPPISLVKVVARYANINRIPLILDIIDPWPDVFLNVLPDFLKNPSKIFLSGYYKSIKNSFSSCKGIFSISNTYLEWAKKFTGNSNVRFKVYYPAVNTSLYRFNSDSIPVNKPLRFIYAGTLGASYDVESIIKVAGIISSEDAEFIIAGDGPDKEKLEKMATHLPHIRFTGWLNGDKLREELLQSDIGIAAYRKHSTQTVTYKLFDYLAAGLPIIMSLDGEMRQIIEENRLGTYFEPENNVNLQSAINEYLNMDTSTLIRMKNRAWKFAHQNGDIHNVYENLVRSMEDIVMA
jgi:glycosyltransferase involved in cell wall biosynthesis